MGPSRKVFAVVELLDETSSESYVEITLTTWLRDNNKKCLWPQSLIATEEVKNIVRNQKEALESWVLVPCKLITNYR